MINKINIDGKILKLVLLISSISSFLIGIITRFNIDGYTKYIILPSLIIIYSYTIFMNLIKKVNMKGYIYLGLFLIVILSYFIVPLAPINLYLNIIVTLFIAVVYIYFLINNNFKIDINLHRWLIKVIPGYLFSNLDYVSDGLNEIKNNNKKTKNILLGLIITIPITIIILLMLTRADA